MRHLIEIDFNQVKIFIHFLLAKIPVWVFGAKKFYVALAEVSRLNFAGKPTSRADHLVANLLQIFSAQKQLRQQQREIEELHQELTKLRAQNDSMRQGMRRCVTCEYRIDVKQRQDESLDEEQNHVGTPSDH